MAIRSQIYILIACLCAVTVTEMFNLLPNSEVLRKLYPFSDQLISLQAWVDYATTRIAYCIFFYILFKFSPRYNEQLFIMWLFSIGYFIDYILFYNQPYGHFGWIPISFTSIRLGAFILIITLTIFDEWT